MTWLTDLALPVTAPCLSAALWYLASAALVTRPLWSRYPRWLGAWASCPACSGTWYGAALAVAFGLSRGWTWFGVPLPWSVPLCGLWTLLWAAPLARLLYSSLVATAPPPDDPGGPS